VTTIVFGTAALGAAYGLSRVDGNGEPLSEAEGLRLVHAAVASGIHTFDTSPAYGESEHRLGLALGNAGCVWTKIRSPAAGWADAAAQAEASLAKSLGLLRRSTIDVLQWHNWTGAQEDDPFFRDAWACLSKDHRVKTLGATTYGVNDALAAASSGLFRCVQVEWNLLNQSVVSAIGPIARARHVGVAVRSVLLQGALTTEGRALPPSKDLQGGVSRARALAQELGMPVEVLAIRAAISQPHIDHVLVGMDRAAQIRDAAAMFAAPRLSTDILSAVRALDMRGHPSTDPRRWTT
jgi:aryl-alcohol dehydrogenase-like predicted oxidoreductase